VTWPDEDGNAVVVVVSGGWGDRDRGAPAFSRYLVSRSHLASLPPRHPPAPRVMLVVEGAVVSCAPRRLLVLVLLLLLVAVVAAVDPGVDAGGGGGGGGRRMGSDVEISVARNG
jgi:hypothetical protein